MIYFTSDLHLGHQNIIKLTNRPFDSVEQMNETLIKLWNQTVSKKDIVYILGDFFFKTPLEKTHEIIKSLHGRKILIKGNHDMKYDEELFEEICDFKVLKYNKQIFVLMHYPLLEWPHFYRGAIHLHGHQHNPSDYNKYMKEQGIKRYDVGVDANMYKPVSIDEIIEFMK